MQHLRVDELELVVSCGGYEHRCMDAAPRFERRCCRCLLFLKPSLFVGLLGCKPLLYYVAAVGYFLDAIRQALRVELTQPRLDFCLQFAAIKNLISYLGFC